MLQPIEIYIQNINGKSVNEVYMLVGINDYETYHVFLRQYSSKETAEDFAKKLAYELYIPYTDNTEEK